jgi:hypothetical protein
VWLVFNAALATYDGYKAYKKAKAEVFYRIEEYTSLNMYTNVYI